MSGRKPAEARAQRAQSIALTEKQAIRIAFRQIGRHLRGSVRSIKNLADLFQVGVGQHLGVRILSAMGCPLSFDQLKKPAIGLGTGDG